MNARVVVPLLAVAAIASAVENWLYFAGDSGPIPAEADPAASEAESAEPASEARTEHAPVEPPPRLTAAELAALLESFDGLRSPFLPGAADDPAQMGMPTLVGLLIGAERRIAWLGHHARREGEIYQGWAVVRVEPARVVLERDGRRYSLWLDESGADAGAAPALPPEPEELR